MNKSLYIPLFSIKERIDYKDFFVNKFLENLKIDYSKIIEIDLPIVSKIDAKVNQFLTNNRHIDFDNCKTNQVYEFISDYDSLIRYLYYSYNPNEDEVLFFKYNQIDRDKNNNLYDSIQSTIYNFEIKTKSSNRNEKFLSKYAAILWSRIVQIINSNKLSQKMLNTKLDIVSFRKISKYYPLSSPKITIKNLGHDKRVFGLIFSQKDFLSLNNDKNFVGYDFDNSLIIYCWNDFFKTVQELVTITIRPDWSIMQKQTILNIDEIENELFKIIKKDNAAISLSFKIHIDNIISFFLDMSSMDEVPSQITHHIK